MNKSSLFKIIALLEGLSFVVLLFIAMPLKYVAGEPWMVQKVGMAHGILFLAYIYAAFWVRKEMGWDQKRLIRNLVLSIVPFGTFFVVRHLSSK